MDSAPTAVVYGIFGRLPSFIDFKGKYTEEQIEEELVKARNNCLRQAKKARTAQERGKFIRSAKQLLNLLKHGFAARLIYEANRNPRGYIAMSLRYGKPEAKRRILAQKRAEIRSRLRRHRR